jgi:hypothetical protein
MQNKKGNPAITASVIIMGVLLTFCPFTDFWGSPSAPPPQSTIPSATPAQSETFKITYKVTGTTTLATIYFHNESEGTDQRKIGVPWERSFKASPGYVLFLFAQNEKDEGRIGCQMLVNDVIVAESVSEGAHAIADCGELLLHKEIIPSAPPGSIAMQLKHP